MRAKQAKQLRVGRREVGVSKKYRRPRSSRKSLLQMVRTLFSQNQALKKELNHIKDLFWEQLEPNDSRPGQQRYCVGDKSCNVAYVANSFDGLKATPSAFAPPSPERLKRLAEEAAPAPAEVEQWVDESREADI